MVVGLDQSLAAAGLSIDLWAAGDACEHLAARATSFNDASDGLPAPNGAQLVAIGTSESPDSDGFVLAARARAGGVTTVGLVDSLANTATRFQGTTNDPLAHLPDHLVVTDECTRMAFINLGVAPARISVAMNPVLQHARARGEVLAQTNRDERRLSLFGTEASPVILFLTEISSGLDPDAFRRSKSYTMTGRGNSDARTDIVLETLLDSVRTLTPRPRVVLRLHPKENPDSYSAYAEEIYSVSVGGDPLEICEAADLVVGMTTTLLAETRQLGQRVMSMVPREKERDWLSDLSTANIPCVFDHAAVTPMIERLLAKPRHRPDAPAGAPLARVLASLIPSSNHPLQMPA